MFGALSVVLVMLLTWVVATLGIPHRFGMATSTRSWAFKIVPSLSVALCPKWRAFLRSLRGENVRQRGSVFLYPTTCLGPAAHH